VAEKLHDSLLRKKTLDTEC